MQNGDKILKEELVRSAMLLGEENINKLLGSKVAIFGIGGVGSFVTEALARGGIGSFALIDDDVVSTSNINRQLIATSQTIGKPKVLLSKERIESINKDAKVEVYQRLYLQGETLDFIKDCDYIVDAIDTVSSKISLVMEAKKMGIKIISCMGTGNKLDPTQFEVADIFKTSVCPLCRVMRRELKARGIKNLKVLYSKEEPLKPLNFEEESVSSHKKRQTPGSVSFVPPVAGMIIASEVIKDLIRK